MLRGSRIGLVTGLVTALVALGASPARAASKKAGTVTMGNLVVLLNTSGFVRVTLECTDESVTLRLRALSGPLDTWIETTAPNGGGGFAHSTVAADSTRFSSPSKPAHFEWSVSRGTKVALGQVYAAGTGTQDRDCVYTSQVS